jgi:hypothetical protein
VSFTTCSISGIREHFRWFDLPFWRLLLWASAHRSQRLIAVSEPTRADLLHYYRLPPERITVIPHGVEPRILARRKRDFRLRTGRDSRLSYPLAGDIDRGAEGGVPDVGCALAECAETGGGTTAGQLSGSRMAAVCGGGGKLSCRVPLCIGDLGRRVCQRRGYERTEDDTGRAVGVPSPTQPAIDGGVVPAMPKPGHTLLCPNETPQDNNHSSHVQRVRDGSQGSFRPRF